MKHDVVYFCRQGDNEELRYSIRSVVANFAYNRIVIVGGKPDYIEPDLYIPIQQHGETAYHAVRNMIHDACEDNRLTPDFWLFNDDFFIMRQLAEYPPQYSGTLANHIVEVELRQCTPTPYTKRLKHLYNTLKRRRPDEKPLDYAVHKPMLINRAKALKVMDEYPDEPMFRALYGNYYHIGGQDAADCKFGTSRKDPPRPEALDVISTSDEAFTGGDIGVYIRSKFPNETRYERGR